MAISSNSNTAIANNNIVNEWEQLNHQVADVADGIHIHFVDVGPRDATPVVLVHGWPDLSFAWRVRLLFWLLVSLPHTRRSPPLDEPRSSAFGLHPHSLTRARVSIVPDRSTRQEVPRDRTRSCIASYCLLSLSLARLLHCSRPELATHISVTLAQTCADSVAAQRRAKSRHTAARTSRRTSPSSSVCAVRSFILAH